MNYGSIFDLWFLSRFSRGSVQTTLPPNKKQRSGRLCSSFDDQIMDLQRDESNINEEAQQRKRRKRDAEESMHGLQGHLRSVKVLIVTHVTDMYYLWVGISSKLGEPTDFYFLFLKFSFTLLYFNFTLPFLWTIIFYTISLSLHFVDPWSPSSTFCKWWWFSCHWNVPRWHIFFYLLALSIEECSFVLRTYKFFNKFSFKKLFKVLYRSLIELAWQTASRCMFISVNCLFVISM